MRSIVAVMSVQPLPKQCPRCHLRQNFAELADLDEACLGSSLKYRGQTTKPHELAIMRVEKVESGR